MNHRLIKPLFQWQRNKPKSNHANKITNNCILFSTHHPSISSSSNDIPNNVHDVHDLDDLDDLDDDNDDDNDNDNIHYTNVDDDAIPWKNILYQPARAKWRTTYSYSTNYIESNNDSESSPPTIVKSLILEQRYIMKQSQRTKKQLYRSHQKMIEHGDIIRQFRNQSRFHPNQNQNHLIPSTSTNTNTNTNTSPSSSSSSSSSSLIKYLGYKPEQTCVYLYHRLLPNFHILERIFYEIQSLTQSSTNPYSYTYPYPIHIKKVLDFGIGCGSASAAAMHVFGDNIEWIHGVDASQSMREVSSHILNHLLPSTQTMHSTPNSSTPSSPSSPSSPPRLTFSESLATNSVSKSSLGTFDLAIFAYTANEIPSHAAILTSAAILWEKLAPNGLFVMVEPGTPDGFQSVRAVREMLLETCPPASTRSRTSNNDDDDDDDDDYDDDNYEHAHIIAPCTHNGSCPMKYFHKPKHSSDVQYDSDDETMDHDMDINVSSRDQLEETDIFSESYCSFVHALPAQDISRSKWTKKKGEKFSYIVIQKRVGSSSSSYSKSNDNQNDHNHNNNRINVVDLLAETIDSSASLHEKYKQIQKNNKQHVKVNEKEMKKQDELFQKALQLERFIMNSDLEDDHNNHDNADNDDLGLKWVVHSQETNDDYTSNNNNIPWGRLIRAPLKKSGHVYVDFCTGGRDVDHSEGRIVRHKVTKGKSSILAPGLFSAARKARWGGLWPDLSMNRYNQNHQNGNHANDGDSYSSAFLKELKVVMNEDDDP